MLAQGLSALLPASVVTSGLLVLLIKATLILMAAVAITRLMHRASAGARHLVWLVAMGALLAVPALAAWTPLRIQMLPPVAEATLVAPRQADAPAASMLRSAPTVSAPATTTTQVVASATVSDRVLSELRTLRGDTLVWVIWLAVTILMIGSLTWSGLAVRRIVRRAQFLDTVDWQTPLWDVADRIGLDEPPRLLVSRDTQMPFACGVLQPTIVLPQECRSWATDRRHAVLLHELAHVRRGDLLGHLLARLVCAAYWFHPLAWMGAKRLRSESERACDDLALACGTKPADYAEHLLDIVTSVRASITPAVALAMARRQEFEGRMLAILDPQLRHAPPTRGQSAALITTLALSAGLIAAAAPVPRTSALNALQQVNAQRTTVAVRPASPAPRELRSVAPLSENHTAAPVARLSAPQVAHASEAPPVPTAKSDAAGRLATTVTTQDGRTPDERATLLAKVLRTDSSAKLRRIAAWGLEEYSKTPAAGEALVNAVRHDADASVREMAAWALADYDSDHDALEALGAALRTDHDDAVRATAAWALGSIGDHGAADALVAGLNDSSSNVRTRSAWGLGNVDLKAAPPGLVSLLRDRDREVRQVAAWSLYQIEDPSALPALEAALRTETDQETQMAYLRAIAVMGDKSVDALSGLLESPDSRIKTMAVRALAGGHATGPWPWPWPEPRPNP